MNYLYITEDGAISQQEHANESGLRDDLESVDGSLLQIIRFAHGRFEQLVVVSESDEDDELVYSIHDWDLI